MTPVGTIHVHAPVVVNLETVSPVVSSKVTSGAQGDSEVDPSVRPEKPMTRDGVTVIGVP
ncbi:unannotated protein [freshwater metagenome]|uniref:Unannotated protein n=1 Tax=freshwater metagenome TaxID=449393 RepID=A0A6J6U5E1_9ZZZZ